MLDFATTPTPLLPQPRQAERSGRSGVNLSGALDKLRDAALALAYPQACAACGARGVARRLDWPACAVCWGETRLFGGAETLCWKCGAPAGGAVPEAKWPSVRCLDP